MLTKKQKKLPMALQKKAIMKKQKKKRKRGNNALSYRTWKKRKKIKKVKNLKWVKRKDNGQSSIYNKHYQRSKT